MLPNAADGLTLFLTDGITFSGLLSDSQQQASPMDLCSKDCFLSKYFSFTHSGQGIITPATF